MTTKRASRAAAKAVLLGAVEAHRSPPGRSFAEVALVFGAPNTNSLSTSRQAVSGGGDFCGGEERSFGVDARSAIVNIIIAAV